MVYLPDWIIQGCPVEYQNSTILSDGTLPRWLMEQPGWRPIPVDWDTTIVHLH
jgi:hypothetical protein